MLVVMLCVSSAMGCLVGTMLWNRTFRADDELEIRRLQMDVARLHYELAHRPQTSVPAHVAEPLVAGPAKVQLPVQVATPRPRLRRSTMRETTRGNTPVTWEGHRDYVGELETVQDDATEELQLDDGFDEEPVPGWSPEHPPAGRRFEVTYRGPRGGR